MCVGSENWVPLAGGITPDEYSLRHQYLGNADSVRTHHQLKNNALNRAVCRVDRVPVVSSTQAGKHLPRHIIGIAVRVSK
jgi:hypothetical protein